MRRLAALLVAGWVAACAAPASGPGALDAAASRPDAGLAGMTCSIGPDGGPLLAERGIGGTGAPARGATEVADRGIGGTGIIGVVTGFGSVCVNGLEVAYDDRTPLDVDGVATSVAALRVGQVALIEASGSPAALHARNIALRREVTGRIEAVELGSGTLTIAGLPVSVPAATWGADRFGLGDFVAVSGLRRSDGVIVASRLDAAPPGRFSARGQVVREGGVRRVGGLVLREADSVGTGDGAFVEVSGRYAGTIAEVTAVVPDRLAADPANYFGASVDHLMVQAFVRVANHAVWVNEARLGASQMPASEAPDKSAVVAAAGNAGSASGSSAVVALERRPDGSFVATGVHYSDFSVHANAPEDGTGQQSPGRRRRSSGNVGIAASIDSDAGPTADAATIMPARSIRGDVDAATAPPALQPAATMSIPISPASTPTLAIAPSSVAASPAGPPLIAMVPAPTAPISTLLRTTSPAASGLPSGNSTVAASASSVLGSASASATNSAASMSASGGSSGTAAAGPTGLTAAAATGSAIAVSPANAPTAPAVQAPTATAPAAPAAQAPTAPAPAAPAPAVQAPTAGSVGGTSGLISSNGGQVPPWRWAASAASSLAQNGSPGGSVANSDPGRSTSRHAKFVRHHK